MVPPHAHLESWNPSFLPFFLFFPVVLFIPSSLHSPFTPPSIPPRKSAQPATRIEVQYLLRISRQIISGFQTSAFFLGYLLTSDFGQRTRSTGEIARARIDDSPRLKPQASSVFVPAFAALLRGSIWISGKACSAKGWWCDGVVLLVVKCQRCIPSIPSRYWHDLRFAHYGHSVLHYSHYLHTRLAGLCLVLLLSYLMKLTKTRIL